MSKKVVIHPVAGNFLQGVPALSLRTDAATAERLVRTGAFSHEPTETTGDAVDFDGSVLDFYDPPSTAEPEPQPAGAGEET